MKSITLIASTIVIALTLTAFTYSGWNVQPTHKMGCQAATEIEPPTFSYDLSPRANNTVTKEGMYSATTVADLVPDFGNQEDLKNNVISVRDVKIRIEDENLHETKHRSEKGNGNSLSAAQMNLLKDTDYSTNFSLEGFYTDIDPTKFSSQDRYFNYYMTVVPETQASYKAGKETLIDFITAKSKSTIDKLQKGNLKSGNIRFTVTTNGSISDISIDSTCGYPRVDKRMVELINSLSEGWNVATDGKGEKVNQVLVFSYGQGGC